MNSKLQFNKIKYIFFFLYFDYITSVTVTQLEKQNRALYIRWNIYFSRFSSVLTHCQTLNIMFYNICFLFPKMHRRMVCSLNIYVTCTITMRFYFFVYFCFILLFLSVDYKHAKSLLFHCQSFLNVSSLFFIILTSCHLRRPKMLSIAKQIVVISNVVCLLFSLFFF